MARKFSLGLFVLISSIGLLVSIRLLVQPAALVPMMAAAHPSVDALRAPEHAALVAFLGRWLATALFGCNLFSLVVALTALRRRERWAAWLMLYWPLMFVSHLLMYAPGPMRVVQVVWICLSVPSLALLLFRSKDPAPQPQNSGNAAVAAATA